jgi:hypothetical protein
MARNTIIKIAALMPLQASNGSKQPTGTTHFQLRPHQHRCGGRSMSGLGVVILGFP